jgi:hypothetical protein
VVFNFLDFRAKENGGDVYGFLFSQKMNSFSHLGKIGYWLEKKGI